MPCFPANRSGRPPQHQRAQQIIDQMHQRRGGRLKVGEFLHDWIDSFAREILNLGVKRFLAGKMFVEQRLGNSGGLRQLFRGRFSKSFACEQRQSRLNNRLLPLFGVHALGAHCW